MMQSKSTRVFLIDDKNFRFNFSVFKRMFLIKAKELNLKLGEYEQFLADELGVSKEAIHNWRNNLNGPSGVDFIEKLALIWKCDVKYLLTEIREIEKEDENMMKNINEFAVSREALKNVYRAMLDFLDFFEKTNGFYTGRCGESRDVLLLQAQNNLNFVINVLKREMLDIPTDLYEKIENFVYNRFHYVMEGEYLEGEESWDDWVGQVIFVSEDIFKEIQELFAEYRL